MRLFRGGYQCFDCLDSLCRWNMLDAYMENFRKRDLAILIDCVSDRKTHGVSALWVLGIPVESDDDGELLYFGDLLSSNNKLEIASVIEKITQVADEHEVNIVIKTGDHADENGQSINQKCVLVGCGKLLQMLSSGSKITFNDEVFWLAEDTIDAMHAQQGSDSSRNGLSYRNPVCILNGYRYLLSCNIETHKGSQKIDEIPGLVAIVKSFLKILKIFNVPGMLSLQDISLIEDTVGLLQDHDNYTYGKMPLNALQTLLGHPSKLLIQKRFFTIWPLEFSIKPYSTVDYYDNCLLARQKHPRLSTTLNLQPIVVNNTCVDCRKSFTELRTYQVHRLTCVMRKVSSIVFKNDSQFLNRAFSH